MKGSRVLTVIRTREFHTIVTFIGILGKQFQDAGLRDVCIESGVVTEGSVAAVLEERRYNRAIGFHKLMYEALMRKAWSGFKTWVTENTKIKKRAVESAFEDLKSLSTNICEVEFGKKLGDPSFSEFVLGFLP